MKWISGWMLAGICVLLTGVATDRVWAQAAGRPGAPSVGTASDKKLLVIRHMPKLNKAKQATPLYSTTATRSTPGRAHEWAVFDVTYDTAPEWMNEVVVTYYLMAERHGAEAKKEISFYQTTVRYVDVARGEHTACAVLPPAALLRYGDQFMGFAVEISSADGVVLDSKSEVAGTTLPLDWWKKPEFTESKSVVKRDSLVDRSKTPFGLINIDDYEVMK